MTTSHPISIYIEQLSTMIANPRVWPKISQSISCLLAVPFILPTTNSPNLQLPKKFIRILSSGTGNIKKIISFSHLSSKRNQEKD